jgi:hypothetical protein
MHNEKMLCTGPGRLCEDLDTTGKFNGLSLDLPVFSLVFTVSHSLLRCGLRIGIPRPDGHDMACTAISGFVACNFQKKELSSRNILQMRRLGPRFKQQPSNHSTFSSTDRLN